MKANNLIRKLPSAAIEIAVFIFFCLIQIFINITQTGQNLSKLIPVYNTLDFSWQIDLVERFAHGLLAGRDFIFTYGPLFQFIQGWPVLLGASSSVAIQYGNIIPLILIQIIVFAFFYAISRNVKQTIIFSIIALGLTNLGQTANVVLLRSLLPLSIISILSLTTMKGNKALLALIAFLPSLYGLIAYDVFIYSVLVSLAFYLISLLMDKNKIQTIFNAFVFILAALLWQLLISFLLSSGTSYTHLSLSTVKTYSYLLNIHWEFYFHSMPLLIPLMVLVAFWTYRSIKESSKTALITALLYGLLILKSALTRADMSHLPNSLMPAFFIIISWLISSKIELSIKIIIIFFISMLVPSHNNIAFLNPKHFIEALQKVDSDISFFSVYSLSPHGTNPNHITITSLGELIRANPEQVMVYPYDSYLLNSFDETYNTYNLQWYAYSNDEIEKITIDKLSVNPPRYIIMAIDGLSAHDLDGIPNLSRNPLFLEWSRDNYEVDQENTNPRYLVLKHNPNKTWKDTEDCLIIKASVSLPSNIVEKALSAIKPPTYYYENESISPRIPFLPFNKDYLIPYRWKSLDDYNKLYSYRGREGELLLEDKIVVINPITGSRDNYTDEKYLTTSCVR